MDSCRSTDPCRNRDFLRSNHSYRTLPYRKSSSIYLLYTNNSPAVKTPSHSLSSAPCGRGSPSPVEMTGPCCLLPVFSERCFYCFNLYLEWIRLGRRLRIIVSVHEANGVNDLACLSDFTMIGPSNLVEGIWFIACTLLRCRLCHKGIVESYRRCITIGRG